MYGNEAVSCIYAFEWYEDSERDIRNLEMNYGVGSGQQLKICNSCKRLAAKVEDQNDIDNLSVCLFVTKRV